MSDNKSYSSITYNSTPTPFSSSPSSSSASSSTILSPSSTSREEIKHQPGNNGKFADRPSQSLNPLYSAWLRIPARWRFIGVFQTLAAIIIIGTLKSKQGAYHEEMAAKGKEANDARKKQKRNLKQSPISENDSQLQSQSQLIATRSDKRSD